MLSARLLESTSTCWEVVVLSTAPDSVITGVTGEYSPVRENNDSLIDLERDVNGPPACPMSVKWRIQPLLSAPSQPLRLNVIRGFN